MSTLDIKRGATFRATLQFDFDVTDYTITGEVWDRGDFVCDLSVRKIGETVGWVEVEAAATVTEDWPLRLLRVELEAGLAGEVVKSETIYLNVKQEIIA